MNSFFRALSRRTSSSEQLEVSVDVSQPPLQDNHNSGENVEVGEQQVDNVVEEEQQQENTLGEDAIEHKHEKQLPDQDGVATSDHRHELQTIGVVGQQDQSEARKGVAANGTYEQEDEGSPSVGSSDEDTKMEEVALEEEQVMEAEYMQIATELESSSEMQMAPGKEMGTLARERSWSNGSGPFRSTLRVFDRYLAPGVDSVIDKASSVLESSLGFASDTESDAGSVVSDPEQNQQEEVEGDNDENIVLNNSDHKEEEEDPIFNDLELLQKEYKRVDEERRHFARECMERGERIVQLQEELESQSASGNLQELRERATELEAEMLQAVKNEQKMKIELMSLQKELQEQRDGSTKDEQGEEHHQVQYVPMEKLKEVHHLRQEVEQFRSRQTELESQLTKMEEKHAEKIRQMEQRQEQLQGECNSLLEEKNVSAETLQATIGQLKATLGEALQERGALEQQVALLTKSSQMDDEKWDEVQDLTRLNAKKDREIQALEEQVSKLNHKASQLMEQLFLEKEMRSSSAPADLNAFKEVQLLTEQIEEKEESIASLRKQLNEVPFQLQKELERKDEQIAALQAELDKEDPSEHEELGANFRKQLETKDEQIAALQAELDKEDPSEHEELGANFRKQLETKDEQITALQAKLDQETRNEELLANLQKELETKEEQITSLQAAIDKETKPDERLASLLKQLETKDERIAVLQQENQNASIKDDDGKQKWMELNEKYVCLQEQEAEKDKVIASLEKQLAQAQCAKDEETTFSLQLQDEITSKQEEITRLTQENRRLAQQSAQLDAKMTALKEESDGIKEEFTNRTDRLRRLEEQVEELRARNRSLQEDSMAEKQKHGEELHELKENLLAQEQRCNQLSQDLGKSASVNEAYGKEMEGLEEQLSEIRSKLLVAEKQVEEKVDLLHMLEREKEMAMTRAQEELVKIRFDLDGALEENRLLKKQLAEEHDQQKGAQVFQEQVESQRERYAALQEEFETKIQENRAMKAEMLQLKQEVESMLKEQSNARLAAQDVATYHRQQMDKMESKLLALREELQEANASLRDRQQMESSNRNMMMHLQQRCKTMENELMLAREELRDSKERLKFAGESKSRESREEILALQRENTELRRITENTKKLMEEELASLQVQNEKLMSINANNKTMLQTELERLRKQNESLAGQGNELVHKLRSENETLKHQNQAQSHQQDGKIRQLMQENEELIRKTRTFEDQQSKTTREMQAAAERITKFERENNELRSKNKETVIRMESLQREMNEIHVAHNAELERVRRSTQRSEQTFSQERGDLERALEEQRTRVVALEKEIGSLKSKRKELQEKLKDFETEKEDLVSKLSTSRKQIERLETRIASVTDSHDEEVAKLEGIITKHEKERETKERELQEEIASLKQQQQQKEDEHSRILAERDEKLTCLEKDLETSQTNAKTLEEEITQLREDHQRGIGEMEKQIAKEKEKLKKVQDDLQREIKLRQKIQEKAEPEGAEMTKLRQENSRLEENVTLLYEKLEKMKESHNAELQKLENGHKKGVMFLEQQMLVLQESNGQCQVDVEKYRAESTRATKGEALAKKQNAMLELRLSTLEQELEASRREHGNQTEQLEQENQKLLHDISALKVQLETLKGYALRSPAASSSTKVVDGNVHELKLALETSIQSEERLKISNESLRAEIESLNQALERKQNIHYVPMDMMKEVHMLRVQIEALQTENASLKGDNSSCEARDEEIAMLRDTLKLIGEPRKRQQQQSNEQEELENELKAQLLAQKENFGREEKRLKKENEQLLFEKKQLIKDGITAEGNFQRELDHLKAKLKAMEFSSSFLRRPEDEEKDESRFFSSLLLDGVDVSIDAGGDDDDETIIETLKHQLDALVSFTRSEVDSLSSSRGIPAQEPQRKETFEREEVSSYNSFSPRSRIAEKKKAKPLMERLHLHKRQTNWRSKYMANILVRTSNRARLRDGFRQLRINHYYKS